MSIEFVLEDDDRVVWRRNNRSSTIFVGIAQAAAAALNCPSGIYYDPEYAVIKVREKQFCELVELVFANPTKLLHPWAQEAAGIYQSIKGEVYGWRWSLYHLPFEAFQVPIHDEFQVTKWSGKHVGESSVE